MLKRFSRFPLVPYIGAVVLCAAVAMMVESCIFVDASGFSLDRKQGSSWFACPGCIPGRCFPIDGMPGQHRCDKCRTVYVEDAEGNITF